MSLKGKRAYDLGRLVDEISSIKGVIAIILFGSHAKGDYDEYSDYDLLIIFKDRSSMWRKWEELFETIGRFRMLIHAIPKSLDEFWRGEPTFLKEVLTYGRLLYAKHPFEAYMPSHELRPMSIIIYHMNGLDQRDKMKALYLLYGRKASGIKGLVEKFGGMKLAEGCLMIPSEHARSLRDSIKKYGVKVKVIEVFLKSHY